VAEVVSVERIAAGGDGVARAADGRTLFVPRTAPGDQVEVSYVPNAKTRFARGTAVARLADGPDRRLAPCVHYRDDGCGGCQLQHIDEGAQRAAKARIVVDAFARIARRPIALPDVVASPSPWHYRRKATFLLRPSGGGFHAMGDPDRLIDVTRCEITDVDVVETLVAVRDLRRLLPSDVEWRVSARLLDGGGIGVTIEGGASGQWSDMTRFTDRLPTVSALWWRPRPASRAVLVMDRRPREVVDAAPAFAQVNAPLAERIAEDVMAIVRGASPGHVIDAYAGSASLSRALALEGVRATAIELDPVACDIARALPVHGLRVVEGAVERELPHALPADVVVVNPPRTGLAPEVPAALEAAGMTRLLVYVSCDPATLARDVSRLSRWQLRSVQCYDLFPQTAHVESVAVLVPGTMNS
jgi:23S rRNA (uracil1939-C5)-methyltransferase